MEAYINAISYYLPERVLTNEEINSQFPEWSVDKISAKTGIFERHISAPGETAADMAVKAAEKLFRDHEIEKDTVDFVLLCTQSPDYFLPTTACLVQDRLGLPTSVGALDFNLGCSGYIYGLSLAKGLVISGAAKNVLFLTSETYTKFIHRADKSNRTIFGDGATASLITSNEGIAEICKFQFGTDGSGAEHLIIKNGAFKHPASDCVDITDPDGNYERNDNYLYMNGKEIFNFTAENVPHLVEKTLKKNRLTIDDINLHVFHQANKYMLNFIRKKIGIEEEKFFIDIEKVGNTVSSTIPIALCMAHKQKKIQGNILIAGFGVGLSWASCLLRSNFTSVRL
jgi:3-oxoacyl-[acyl-carrier-protein] synthase-3